MRPGRWLNGTTRGLLILAAIAGVIVVLQLYQTLFVFLLLARIAFFLAIAYFVFLMWRERREGISMWPQRARISFYGSAAVGAADIGAISYGGAHGFEVIAFVGTLALCVFTMVRTWRDQHHYV